MFKMNFSKIEYKKPRSLSEILYSAISQGNDSLAIIERNGMFTYDQLLDEVHKLLYFFEQNKIGAEHTVAVLLDKTFSSVALLLSLFIKGCCVVPIDIGLPRERQRKMIEISKSTLVIGDDVSDLGSVEFLNYPLNIDGKTTECSILSDPINPISAVYFTSGSTADPKAVQFTNESIAHYCEWHARNIFKSKKLKVAQLASLSFDASLKDIIPSVLTHSTLYLPNSETPYLDINQMIRWVEQSKIEVIQTVPSVVKAICNDSNDSSEFFNHMKVLCLAGEALTTDICNAWFRSFPKSTAKIFNMYGATETCILKSCFEVDKGISSRLIPIGKPIDCCDLVVLDSRGEKTRTKIVGEVYIVVPYRLYGYMNAENSSFQYLEKEDITLYKTGDKGRYEIDGNIVILGRVDRELKINGVRLNPEEIESALRQHKSVQEAYVIGREFYGKMTVIAYVVTKVDGEEFLNELRSFLHEKLPPSIVPGIFIKIDKIPLNQNGKVDVASLPAPKFDILVVEPTTETEKVLMSIWEDILGREVLSIEAEYFSFGMNSLDLAKILMKVNSHYSLNIGLGAFLKSKTIKQQADLIEDALNVIGNNMQQNFYDLKQNNSSMAPLSSQQSRLYFLSKLGHLSDYNMTGSYKITGELDKTKLINSLKALIKKHDSLRTSFIEVNGLPMQTIHSEVEFTLDYQDLTEFQKSNLFEKIDQALLDNSRVELNLNEAPLMKMSLLKIAPDQHILIYVLHHIIGDGWSGDILMRDLASYWNSFEELSEKTPEIVKPEFNYIDYVIAQHALHDKSEYLKQVDFWKGRAEQLSNTKSLNIKFNQDARLYDVGSNIRFNTGEMTHKIREACEHLQCSPYVLFLSAFFVILFRRSRVSKLTVGTDVMGRNTDNLKDIVGFFVNTLPFSIELSETDTFLTVLEKVKQERESLFDNQYVQFEKIVSLCDRDKVDDSTPLFNMFFRYWDASFSPSFKNLDLEPYQHIVASSKCELTLALIQNSNDFILEYEYNSGIFKKNDIQTLNQQLLKIIDSHCRNSKQNIIRSLLSDKPIFPHNLEKDLYRNPFEYITETASKYLNKVAVETDTASISYSELIEESEKIAMSFSKMGMVEGEIVAILVNNSIELVLMMLACFKLKLTFVLIDNQLPINRKLHMIRSVGTNWLGATVDAIDSEVSGFINFKYAINDTFNILSKNKMNNPVAAQKNSHSIDNACIFFTSGSTGTPKPILYSASSISHFINWQLRQFKIDQSCNYAQLISTSFDAILRDILLPLFSGGTLKIPTYFIKNDVDALLNWIDANRINLIHTVPSILKTWMGCDSQAHLKTLDFLFLSGEPISKKLIESFRKKYDQKAEKRIINFYGPSETLMISTFYEISKVDEFLMIPAGMPIDGSQVFVLNHEGNPVGPYEVGEVYIQTVYGTFGYYIPKDNQGKFIVKDIMSHSVSLYRTGDLAVFDNDEKLHVIGRLDNQIKINGIRINLEEIEKIIINHPLIQETCVVQISESDEKSTLICFYQSNTEVDLNEILEILERSISQIFYPERFYFLKEFPVLNNGKIDRKKLIDMAINLKEIPSVNSDYPEQNEYIEKVKTIFQELLEKENIDSNDNFFRIGGHSLLATLLVTKIRQAFDVDYSLRDILAGPTPDSIAGILKDRLELKIAEV